MKKLLALVITLLVLAVPVMAQQLGAQKALSARIHKMGAFGNGLAISQTDSMDFELLKVGIAGVKVGTTDEAAEVRVGILYFGEDKYRLKDVEIGNGSASANIYDSEGTQIGSISVDSYPRGDKEVWAGTLTLSDAAYNAYVIQAPRIVKAVEKAYKVFDYCKNNPVKCKAAMRAVGNVICDPEGEGTTCRDRIKTFCENNPEDRRCVALKLAYCRLHLDDADCRASLMDKCKENYNEEGCEKLGTVYNKIIEKRPQVAQVVEKAPAWFKTVRDRIKSRLQPQLNATGGE